MRVVVWFQRHPGVRTALAAVVVLVGSGVALVTVAVGHCSAFGGTCPRQPEPWWESEVLGGVGIGIGMAVLAVVLAIRPDRRGLALGAALALGTGLLAGLAAIEMTSTFW